MRRPIILAACASMAIATSAAAIDPGQWQSTTQMTDIQLPGDVPPQVADMVRQQMGEAASSSMCITQDDIDDAPQRLFDQSEGECSYSEFNMEGGQLNATATCDTGQGTLTMTMSGTYTATTYEMQMSMNGDAGMGPMSMTYETTGERAGSCS